MKHIQKRDTKYKFEVETENCNIVASVVSGQLVPAGSQVCEVDFSTLWYPERTRSYST